MEAAAGVANGRVVSLPMSASSASSSASHQVRKEWRAISEHSARSASGEELERMKMGQSDERTIYEQRAGTIDVEYGQVDGDLMQQRLHDVSMQRERLQQMEIDMRAQMLSRSEIIEMQNRFSEQLNEHVNAAVKLKEHLQEREQAIRELELRIEEKDRELRAIKIDNEAAWAKEDLIREQNKELMAYRRERDNYETERAQQLQQIHDLKEHIQDKERQFLELEEQHRVLQETILYKDEQLREAQAWVARMDAMQSTTNHSLQTELRERTEQFNHFWLGCSRQFADMENHIRQLQIELVEARQRSGMYTEEPSLDRTNSDEASSFVQVKGSQGNVNEDGTLSGNSGVLPNGNADDNQSFAATAPVKTDHGPGVPLPSSVLGLGAYIPPGQVTTLHPFFIPQQGVPQSVPSGNSHIPETHMGHFLPMPAISSHHVWQNQEVVTDASQLSSHIQYQPSQIDQNISTSSAQYEYGQSAEGHILHPGYVVANAVPDQEVGSINTEAREEAQQQNLGVLESQQNQENSGTLHEELRIDSSDKKIETKVADDPNATQHSNLGIITEKQQSASSTPISSDLSTPSNPDVTTEHSGSGIVLPDSSILTGRAANLLPPEKVLAPRLLDERSLLACIVRAIPAGSGGRVKISSTLPNRLGKMLAPLHWHDYKKKYGKLDDFVAGHPELFFIEGDFIQLREGAQEMISATAAIAKVAAAAAATIPYTSVVPSVAVTPMAQTHRLKKVPSIDGVLPPLDAGDKVSNNSTMQNQHGNGVSNIVQGLSNVKILSKSKYQKELNGSEVKSAQSSVHMSVANGANPDGTRMASHQNKGATNGRQGVNFVGKQQGRDAGGALTSRR